jgi:hypothetical protein
MTDYKICSNIGRDAVVRFECENSAIDVIINFLWKIFHKPIDHRTCGFDHANFGGFSNFCRYYTLGVLDTTLCDKVCQWLSADLWFSLGTPVSSTNNTDCQEITKIHVVVQLPYDHNENDPIFLYVKLTS